MLAALELSNMSVAASAASQGLTAQRLYWWRSRLAPHRDVDLVPVRIDKFDRISDIGPTEAVVIRLPSGAVVEVPACKPPPTCVAASLRVLEEG